MSHPKLFISYSWSSDSHQEFVLRLAGELRANGVDAILDKWDLKEGHDANAFMEKMVTDPDITKVVCIVDKLYADKANKRKGGVGTESQIISQELYTRITQSKFVAVVTEKDENGTPYLPVYFQGLVFIDFSNEENYAQSFEQLLRWVFDKPLHIKPEIGRQPAFLDTENAVQLPTNLSHKRALDAIKNHKPHALGTLNEYLNTLAESLERFRIVPKGGIPFDDDLVIKSIDEFLPYRNEFIQLVKTLCNYSSNDEYGQALHNFFEKLIPYLHPPEGTHRYHQNDFDNFKFIVHELFLYTTAITLQHECFNFTHILISSDYYAGDKDLYGNDSMVPCFVFRDYMGSLDQRNQRLNLSRASLRADLLKERSGSAGLEFNKLMQADFVIFMRAEMTGYQWWPETLIYASRFYDKPFEIFARASSKKYFEKIKQLLNIETPEDLTPLLNTYRENRGTLQYTGGFRINPPALLNFVNLCKKA